MRPLAGGMPLAFTQDDFLVHHSDGRVPKEPSILPTYCRPCHINTTVISCKFTPVQECSITIVFENSLMWKIYSGRTNVIFKIIVSFFPHKGMILEKTSEGNQNRFCVRTFCIYLVAFQDEPFHMLTQCLVRVSVNVCEPSRGKVVIIPTNW